MKKMLIAISLILIMSMILAPVCFAKSRSLKVAHIFSPTHPATKGLLKFKEIVENDTNGDIKVDVYDSGVLGGDVEELQQVIAGTLDAAVIMGISIWQGYDSRAAIEEIPFLFENEAAAHKALDGEFGKILAESVLDPIGAKVLCFWENGFRNFTNNKRSIVAPDDMKGIKFRSAQSAIRIKMFNTLGASAIPMAFPELFTGLQQGTVDGQENPLAVIESSKFYEVQKYLSLSGHIYNAGVFIISPKLWNSLSEENQAIVLKASKAGRDYERELLGLENAKTLENLKASGMEVNEVNKEAFIKAVQPVWDDFKKEHGSELLDLAVKK